MPERRIGEDGGTINIGSNYTPDELEFIKAVDKYKREKRRPFPTFVEILHIAKELGWRQVAPNDPVFLHDPLPPVDAN